MTPNYCIAAGNGGAILTKSGTVWVREGQSNPAAAMLVHTSLFCVICKIQTLNPLDFVWHSRGKEHLEQCKSNGIPTTGELFLPPFLHAFSPPPPSSLVCIRPSSHRPSYRNACILFVLKEQRAMNFDMSRNAFERDYVLLFNGLVPHNENLVLENSNPLNNIEPLQLCYVQARVQHSIWL